MAFIKLTHCLACGSKKLKKVLNLNNQPLANSYLSKKEKNVFFVGRLAQYKYFNMDQAVASALKNSEKISQKF